MGCLTCIVLFWIIVPILLASWIAYFSGYIFLILFISLVVYLIYKYR